MTKKPLTLTREQLAGIVDLLREQAELSAELGEEGDEGEGDRAVELMEVHTLLSEHLEGCHEESPSIVAFPPARWGEVQPPRHHGSAAHRFTIRYDEAIENLDTIRDLLRKECPTISTDVNWGHVGNLDEVNRLLSQVVSFLRNEG